MSFSSEVKEELCTLPLRDCCRVSLTYGMLETGHAFGGANLSLQTENEAVAALYKQTVTAVCGLASLREQRRDGGFFLLSVDNADDRRRVLARFGHTPEDVSVRLNRANLECEDCAAAYLRGAFLACGAVSNPESAYHLEFDVPHYRLSRDLLALLNEMGLHAKYINRKGGHVVYFKESEQIEDCLTRMGAANASLELMGVKMVKNIRNNANRVTNCENANIDKTVAASAAQVDAVKRILAAGSLDALPPDLRTLAALRLENPELSLRELGEELAQRGEKLTRSGINHRLRRIMAFADKL